MESPSFEGFPSEMNNNDTSSPKRNENSPNKERRSSKTKPPTPGKSISGSSIEKSSLSKLAGPSKIILKGYKIPKLGKNKVQLMSEGKEALFIQPIEPEASKDRQDDVYAQITTCLQTLVQGQNEVAERLDMIEGRITNIEDTPMMEQYEQDEFGDDEVQYDTEYSEGSDQEILDPETSRNEADEGMSRFRNLKLQYQKNEPVDKEVDPRLAHHVNSAFLNGISDRAIQESSAARPENCTALQPVRVNQMIWDPLTKLTKWKDIKISECQANIMKAAAIITKFVQSSAEMEVSMKGELLLLNQQG